MKKIIFILFLLIAGHLSAQTDTISINGFRFFTKRTILKNEFNSKDTLMKFYRIDNGKPRYLLQYYTYNFSADCNNEVVEKGSMEVHADSVFFITAYSQKTGQDPLPVMRKQIYKMNSAGQLMLVFDKILERWGEWVNTKEH